MKQSVTALKQPRISVEQSIFSAQIFFDSMTTLKLEALFPDASALYKTYTNTQEDEYLLEAHEMVKTKYSKEYLVQLQKIRVNKKFSILKMCVGIVFLITAIVQVVN